MLEKPEIPDELIISCVQAEYRLEVAQITFLPLGYDVNTAVYRIDAHDHRTYFLKLRKGSFDLTTVAIPHFLSNLGIPSIIAPLETSQQQLFGRLSGGRKNYWLILYPFIPGKDGYQVKLADHQWRELGSTLKRVHRAQIPAGLIPLVPQETYNPAWRESVKQFQSQVEKVSFEDQVAAKLAGFLRAHRQEIYRMVERAEVLAYSLCRGSQDFVLCHSDAHPGNFLIADDGRLYLVDWDSPIFAPKERDLMFFGAGMMGDLPGGLAERLFYEGYGQVDVNQTALAYYRYERIIQDIAEFCKQLLLTTDGGDDREQAYTYFTSSFLPGNVIEAAMLTDQYLTN